MHQYIWTSPDEKTHNQTDHMLIDVDVDVESFKRAKCDTDRYLVVAKLRERLAVRKKSSIKFNIIYNHRKPN
jgi:hypothetical protein